MESLIFIDGPNNTGKTTLVSKLAKEINFQAIITDRGPLGFAVYDKMFRNTTNDRYSWLALDERTITILLMPSLDSIEKMCLMKGEVFDRGFAAKESAEFLREAFVYPGKIHVFMYDEWPTSDEVAKYIAQYLKEVTPV